ncbi:hypothetical protein JCM19236_3869 [Vibrio sp. JCM 19236]|nr:hypothetical protein JCM19236_3869 [Vibrio sp. JCM 19236]
MKSSRIALLTAALLSANTNAADTSYWNVEAKVPSKLKSALIIL